MTFIKQNFILSLQLPVYNRIYRFVDLNWKFRYW